MILYTIMDTEFVLRHETPKTTPKMKEIVLNGIRLEVNNMDEQNYIINRIISTNPSDYLRPEIQPGMSLTVDINPAQ
jgi:hypothetical protein